jgi:hypothetical protein
LPFTNTKKAEFKSEFGDLVKLEAKSEQPKISKSERRKKQREREKELNEILDK